MKGYLSEDGVTRFTDPFWRIICDECGITYWACQIDCRCPECGSIKGKCLNNEHLDISSNKFSKRR